jgi:MFS family permease
MFLSGALCLAFSIIWATAARERQYTGVIAELMKQRPGPLQGLKQVFTVKEIWLLCLAEVFIIGNSFAVMGIIPTYLVNKGMSENQAGVFVALSTLTSLVGMVVGPYLSDRVGLRKIFVWPFLLVSAGIIALLPILWGWALYVIWMANGFVVGCGLPQLRAVVMELEEIGPVLSGSAFGAVFTFNRIGGFLVPWLMGLVMTTFSPAAGLYFIALSALIPVVLVLFIRETGVRRKAS